MAVTQQTPRNVSTAATNATVFAYGFKINAKADLLVTVNGSARVVDVDFTVTGVGSDAGGNLTFLDPLVGGETVLRMRNMALARSTDYQANGDLRAATVNNDHDAAVMMIQQIAEIGDRSLRFGPSVIGFNAQLPPGVGLAPLVFSADGKSIQAGSTLFGPANLPTRINVYAESGETSWFGNNLTASAFPNQHIGISNSAAYIGLRSGGSGVAGGPASSESADYGVTISAIKQDFSSSTRVGEIDALHLVCRQGGPTSDVGAIIANVAHYGTGFSAFAEATVMNVVANNVIDRQVRIQSGVIDNVTPQSFGHFVGAEAGVIQDAFRCGTIGGTFTRMFRGQVSGEDKFIIDAAGNIILFDAANNKKRIRASAGSLTVVNDANTVDILTLTDHGHLTITAVGALDIVDEGGSVRNLPINSQSAAYTVVFRDAGKIIYHPNSDTTARTWTIPSNAEVAFPIGAAITFDNDLNAGVITIAITTDTLVEVGYEGRTGTRTLLPGVQARAVKVTATRWRIFGVGLD